MSHLSILLKRVEDSAAAGDTDKLGRSVQKAAEYTEVFDDATPDEITKQKEVMAKYPGMVDNIMLGSLRKRREMEKLNRAKMAEHGQ